MPGGSQQRCMNLGATAQWEPRQWQEVSQQKLLRRSLFYRTVKKPKPQGAAVISHRPLPSSLPPTFLGSWVLFKVLCMFIRVKETGHTCISQLYSKGKKTKTGERKVWKKDVVFIFPSIIRLHSHSTGETRSFFAFFPGFLLFIFLFTLGKKTNWNIYIINLTPFWSNPINFTSLSQNKYIFCKHLYHLKTHVC